MSEEAPEATMEDTNLGTLALPTLPTEALMEILARLPAKSVGRFRCVSRWWCSMLSSDYFFEFHRRHANRPDRPRLLLTAVGSSYEGHLHSWQPSGAVERLMPDDFLDGEIVPVTKPCEGLILVFRGTDYGGYFVCNPSTGTVLPLPDSKAPLKMIRRTKLFPPYVPPFFLNVSYGLGYCPVRKKHKVVRLFSNPEGEDDMTPTSCEVFILDAPAYWRPSAEQPPLCSVEENPAVLLHGRLHFLCSDGGITTFNIRDETFGLLLPPRGFQNVEPVLAELDGSLCVCYGEPDSQDTYHVSVLRDYKEGRWEMLCYIDGTTWSESDRALLKSLWLAPLGMYCSDGGQKIMFGTGACKVFAVDFDGCAPQILFTPDETIIGSCEDSNVPMLGLFEESLVHVGHTVEEMIASSPSTEAWFNILKWLPTRSVLEFGLVCRAWRAMTMMDEFI